MTGASAGIGQSFAELLAASGHDLIVVARRRERLEELAAQLLEAYGATTEVMVADLGSAAGVDAVAARAAEVPLDLLVNNAGFGGYRRFMDLDPTVADQLVSIHVRAVVQVTRAALPGMVARGRGGVITVASLLALSGPAPAAGFLPQRATYAAGKAFQLAFTQLLATELAGTPVRAMVCLPGLVKTEFHEVQGIDTTRMPPRMAPEDVARAALAGLAKGEVVCVPGLEDPAPLGQIDQAQAVALAAARSVEIATRYRTG
ncbi:MAG TPA: SDR family NAD(P)-dependent oxidoreductase [Polyangia bacterium]|nr:SDR family NAD(P)-dependent oxidoreductase [Polyangia bacterium]